MTPAPLWPAQLDHVVRESDQPATLVNFYFATFGFSAHERSAGQWFLEAPQRRMLIRAGSRGAQPLHAFRVNEAGQLDALRAWCKARQLTTEPYASPWLSDAFTLADPDGRQIAFGIASPAPPARPAAAPPAAARLPGRLQHVVVATSNLPRLTAFYRDALGFLVSDDVVDYAQVDEAGTGVPGRGDVTASFFRSDPEHHSFAAFQAPQIRPDHISFEVGDWNAIRDWADHMGDCRIKLWWGPGRHGPGNNLFFMIEDPEGYKLELSAELEIVPAEVAPRTWKHEERTLNLWGNAWMRS